MALFGWDCSHFDWDRGPMDLAAARADGITFVTHKIGEGLNYTDQRFASFAGRARAAGFEFIGAYFVNHTSYPEAQAERCIALADAAAPWWRSFPGWFWQVDAENWATDFPPPESVKRFADRLSTTGKRVIVYASRGQYGDTLAGITQPLWNAAYGNNPVVGYRAAYPGDGSSRWAIYSGQSPVFLQYGSLTRIGTQPNCDANAFRGTLDQLRALLMTSVTLEGDDMDAEQDRKLGNLDMLNTALLTGQTTVKGVRWPDGTLHDYELQFAKDAAAAASYAKTAAERPYIDPVAAAAALASNEDFITKLAIAVAGRVPILPVIPTAEQIATAVLDEQHKRDAE